MKKIIYIIVTSIILGMTFGCWNQRCIVTANPLPDWWENREFTVSKIYYIQPGPYIILKYKYFLNGIEYEGSWAPSSGDYSYSYEKKYEIAYNPDNPQEHFLLVYRPVIKDEKIDAVTLSNFITSKHIILKKNRPELHVNWGSCSPSFGQDSKNIKKIEVGKSPHNDLNRLKFYIEHHDTMLYYQNHQHRVYLLSYSKSNPINSILHYEHPIGLEKYSWTRFMGGEVTDARLRKIQRRSRRFVKRHGKGAYYYYPNAFGEVPNPKTSIEKLKNFKPKDRKGNDLDVDIVIVTDSLINGYFEKYVTAQDTVVGR